MVVCSLEGELQALRSSGLPITADQEHFDSRLSIEHFPVGTVQFQRSLLAELLDLRSRFFRARYKYSGAR